MDSMVEILAEYAHTQPDTLFCADVTSEYTYKEAFQKTRELATKLVNMGIHAGECVMVECTQDSRFLITDFACELAGLIFVPVEHKAAGERITAILEESEAALFLYEVEHEVDTKKMSLMEFFDTPFSGNIIDFDYPELNQVVEILYTTGTTGKSKGIEVTNCNNIAIAENIKYGTEMKSGNTELLPLPLSHSHGIRCCYANLLNGGTILILDGVMRVQLVFDMLDKYNATALDLSPSAVLILMKLSKGKLAEYADRIDYIQVGTAALPEETKQIMIDNFPNVRLYNFYGSTESGRTCVLDFNAERGRTNCIGRPTKNAHFVITDDERHEIVSSEENTGLIATAGPMNMKGYFKQPELTRETMRNGYIYTNDLGYIDKDGFVYVLGRRDDIINFKGIKIAPEEIEESVRHYKDIIDCACVPKPDKISGQVPKLFISVKDRDAFSREDFYAFIEKQLDRNKIPKEIEIIDEIPRTYNGKIQRAKLIKS